MSWPHKIISNDVTVLFWKESINHREKCRIFHNIISYFIYILNIYILIASPNSQCPLMYVWKPSTALILCMYVCDAPLCRSADPVWREPLRHLFQSGLGRDGEAGGAWGPRPSSHLIRLVPGHGLALLRPGAPHRRAAAHSCKDDQAAAQQSLHGLTHGIEEGLWTPVNCVWARTARCVVAMWFCLRTRWETMIRLCQDTEVGLKIFWVDLTEHVRS